MDWKDFRDFGTHLVDRVANTERTPTDRRIAAQALVRLAREAWGELGEAEDEAPAKRRSCPACGYIPDHARCSRCHAVLKKEGAP